MVLFFALVGAASLLTPHRLRAIGLSYSDKIPRTPFDQRGWLESRYYIPTLRLIGIACLAVAAFLTWLTVFGSS